jgi:hypothetical protein
VRQKIDGVPEKFIFHDLRHYLTARAHHSRRLRALMAGHDESIGADKIDAHYAGNLNTVDQPARALRTLNVVVERELRPGRLRVFAGIAVLACNGFTCGNMLVGCLRVCMVRVSSPRKFSALLGNMFTVGRAPLSADRRYAFAPWAPPIGGWGSPGSTASLVMLPTPASTPFGTRRTQ